MLARILYHKDEGNLDAAMKLIAEEPYELWQLTAYSILHHGPGNMAESNAALQTLIEEHHQIAGSAIALVYATRGETDKTLEWLQKAVESEGPRILTNNWYVPEFEILHGDPRWEEMLTSAGRSKQQLATIEFEFKLPE